ncbi:MAG: hypothetical protein MI746_16030 [Pseudomonadales bacterium]|nr:hypothetical protein [Pseudomonadales bacterium]
MAKLQRIGVLFTAKLAALSMGVLGLVAGVFYSFGGFFFELFTDSLNAGTALAFLALLGMPLLFAVSGFLAGGTVAVIYNVAARLGIRIESDL